MTATLSTTRLVLARFAPVMALGFCSALLTAQPAAAMQAPTATAPIVQIQYSASPTDGPHDGNDTAPASAQDGSAPAHAVVGQGWG